MSKKIKVLWIGNVVLPDFCDVFAIKRTIIGGWLDGFYHVLKDVSFVSLGFCFPIFDSNRMKDGEAHGCKFYSFKAEFHNSYISDTMIDRFKAIINHFKPDVIHIWGTEYNHSLAMYRASEQMGMVDHTLVSIQGLVSIYAKHYLVGMKFDESGGSNTIEVGIKEGREIFVNRGKAEVELLSEARHIAGRTEWDKACASQLNQSARYHYLSEILRSCFYDSIGSWRIEKVNEHTIFMSQAHYPIKGLHIVLEALAIVCDFYPDVQLHIAGGDITAVDSNGKRSWYGEYIDGIVSTLSLQNRIQFLGYLDEKEMINEYQKANLFVSASLIENSSNSICEAMLIGTPVISSCVGGCQDLIKHGESGFLFDVNAPYMLAHYICKLFNDAEVCKKISTEETKCISKRIDPTEIKSEIINIYENISV